jgi:hypothetical protein
LSQAAQYLFQEEVYNIPLGILVIVPKPWHTILEEEKALLAKILGSVRISVGSVTIMTQRDVSMEALQVYKPAKVLIFGSSVNADVKPYDHVVLNGVSVINAHDLSELDDARKKSLWLALRQMFGV